MSAPNKSLHLPPKPYLSCFLLSQQARRILATSELNCWVSLSNIDNVANHDVKPDPPLTAAQEATVVGPGSNRNARSRPTGTQSKIPAATKICCAGFPFEFSDAIQPV